MKWGAARVEGYRDLVVADANEDLLSVAFLDLTAEALVNAAVADANDGEQKDSRDDEDDGDAAELAALMLSL